MTQLADNTKSKGLQRFLSALLQVDRLGVPISGVLSEQAAEMRAQRKDRAREQGQKVTIKILMPLMLCFLPAMFVVILGPAIWQLVQAFGKI
jgi:tight adherence protein C